MKPKSMKAVIDRKRYDTEKATLIAGNDHWDGHNFERSGRNTFLYRTAGGNFFAVYLTQWQGEQDSIEPLDEEAATAMFEGMSEQRVPFEEAFPKVKVQEA